MQVLIDFLKFLKKDSTTWFRINSIKKLAWKLWLKKCLYWNSTNKSMFHSLMFKNLDWSFKFLGLILLKICVKKFPYFFYFQLNEQVIEDAWNKINHLLYSLYFLMFFLQWTQRLNLYKYGDTSTIFCFVCWIEIRFFCLTTFYILCIHPLLLSVAFALLISQVCRLRIIYFFSL